MQSATTRCVGIGLYAVGLLLGVFFTHLLFLARDKSCLMLGYGLYSVGCCFGIVLLESQVFMTWIVLLVVIFDLFVDFILAVAL